MIKKKYQVQFRTQRGSVLTRTVDASSERHAVQLVNEQQDRTHNYVKEFISAKEFKK